MSTDEGFHEPRVDIVSMYVDQLHPVFDGVEGEGVLHSTDPAGRGTRNPADIAVTLSEVYSIPIFPTVRGALHVGAQELNVDAVLLIGEHGDYPHDELGRILYPQRALLEQICGCFADAGRSVPVCESSTYLLAASRSADFETCSKAAVPLCCADNDKHLGGSWADASWMHSRCHELGAPLLAGSSLVVCWRKPQLEYALGKETLTEATILCAGAVETVSPWHALEAMQCMIERRAGGETGIVAVQCLEGPEVWAARDISWSTDLALAALAVDPAAGEEPGLVEMPC